MHLVSETDLLRLKAIARLHARLLPADVTWSDLLQEAFARVLDGSRNALPGVPLLAFLGGVMRSIKAEYWRRARREALQELAVIYHLFADDPQACHIIAGLAEERSPEEICESCGMSKTDYDSTRRRMRRLLLREGLRTRQK